MNVSHDVISLLLWSTHTELRRRWVECFHQASGLFFDFLFPVRLSGRNENVRVKFFDLAIEWAWGLDLDLWWKVNGAVGAILRAVRTVLGGAHLGKDVLVGAGAAQGEQRAQHGWRWDTKKSVSLCVAQERLSKAWKRMELVVAWYSCPVSPRCPGSDKADPRSDVFISETYFF